MPTEITSRLKKTGYRALFNGKKFDYKTVSYHVCAAGVIEACYHADTANELVKLSAREFSDENIRFICAANYLLCRKSGVGAKTGRVATIDRHVTYEQAMRQIFQKYIYIGSEFEVNIAASLRTKLTANAGGYCSSGNISQLIKARAECLSIVFPNIRRNAEEVPVSKNLVKYLKMSQSPTDQEVKRRLAFPNWFE